MMITVSSSLLLLGFVVVIIISACTAFTTTTTTTKSSIHYSNNKIVSIKDQYKSVIEQQQQQCRRHHSNNNNVVLLHGSVKDDEIEEEECWNPSLRKIMAGVATLGSIETAYLTWNKLSESSSELAFCNTLSNGSCNDVLNGPYATLPGGIIPLAAIGCLVYTTTAIVAIAPVLDENKVESSWNRTVLLMLCTGLGTVSIFLLLLLYNVLHQSCLYCYTSASFSLTLCACAYLGGLLPPTFQEENDIIMDTVEEEQPPSSLRRTTALQASTYTFIASVLASFVLFVNVDDSTAADNNDEPGIPPEITTTSSKKAIQLSKTLKSMDATMYGAFWCSHCNEQKQAFGKEAFTTNIQYVECSKDGLNQKSNLCKKEKIPGYPTWVIDGKQYPGEKDLDELQSIIKEIKQTAK